MCRYKIYHQSDHGYIVRCHSCEHIQLAFGTSVMTYTREQFNEFVDSVYEYYTAYQHECSRKQKTIRIPTLSASISLAFSLNELEILMNMLEEAAVLIETDKILTM